MKILIIVAFALLIAGLVSCTAAEQVQGLTAPMQAHHSALQQAMQAGR